MKITKSMVVKNTINLELDAIELAALRGFIAEGLQLIHNEVLKRTMGSTEYPPPGLRYQLADQLYRDLNK